MSSATLAETSLVSSLEVPTCNHGVCTARLIFSAFHFLHHTQRTVSHAYHLIWLVCGTLRLPAVRSQEPEKRTPIAEATCRLHAIRPLHCSSATQRSQCFRPCRKWYSLCQQIDGVRLLYMLSIREVLHHHQHECRVRQDRASSDADIAEDRMLIVDLRCRSVSPLLMGSVDWPEARPPFSGWPAATQAMSDTSSLVSETQDLHCLLFQLAGTS